MERIYKKIERVRKPRVHIQYEVETDHSTIKKELPFVVGVIGHFSGDSNETSKPFKDKNFVQIDKDNFNHVMKSLQPTLNFRVNNVIANNQTEIPVSLKFNRMEDFEPVQIINQIPILKKIFDIRNKLRDLAIKIDCSIELETILEKIVQNKNDLERLAQELGITP